MEVVGSFEAKTHLAALLDRVAKGETIIIAKHGKPVARLAPLADLQSQFTVEEAIAGLMELRKSHDSSVEEIKSVINEGRKH